MCRTCSFTCVDDGCSGVDDACSGCSGVDDDCSGENGWDGGVDTSSSSLYSSLLLSGRGAVSMTTGLSAGRLWRLRRDWAHSRRRSWRLYATSTRKTATSAAPTKPKTPAIYLRNRFQSDAVSDSQPEKASETKRHKFSNAVKAQNKLLFLTV